jgi:hypothetical protein
VSMRARRLIRPQLALEFLEGRTVPAVVVTQLDLDGDGAADDIRIVGEAGTPTFGPWQDPARRRPRALHADQCQPRGVFGPLLRNSAVTNR